jgi:hypothetical protein
MSDEVIPCADCRIDFVFTASEAAFFASKGLTKPRRCKACRQKRRDAKTPPATEASGSPAAHTPRQSQWVGGGEEEAPRRFRNKGRERRRDRYDGHEF